MSKYPRKNYPLQSLTIFGDGSQNVHRRFRRNPNKPLHTLYEAIEGIKSLRILRIKAGKALYSRVPSSIRHFEMGGPPNGQILVLARAVHKKLVTFSTLKDGNLLFSNPPSKVRLNKLEELHISWNWPIWKSDKDEEKGVYFLATNSSLKRVYLGILLNNGPLRLKVKEWLPCFLNPYVRLEECFMDAEALAMESNGWAIHIPSIFEAWKGEFYKLPRLLAIKMGYGDNLRTVRAVEYLQHLVDTNEDLKCVAIYMDWEAYPEKCKNAKWKKNFDIFIKETGKPYGWIGIKWKRGYRRGRNYKDNWTFKNEENEREFEGKKELKWVQRIKRALKGEEVDGFIKVSL